MGDTMRENDLRAHQECSYCQKRIGHAGLPFFYTLVAKCWTVDMEAIQRQDGLTKMMGGHAALANIMGPDEVMARAVSETVMTVCATCAMEHQLPVGEG